MKSEGLAIPDARVYSEIIMDKREKQIGIEQSTQTDTCRTLVNTTDVVSD